MLRTCRPTLKSVVQRGRVGVVSGDSKGTSLCLCLANEHGSGVLWENFDDLMVAVASRKCRRSSQIERDAGCLAVFKSSKRSRTAAHQELKS
ncbi:hypothetical protein MRB53_039534 [Persea americana]|nr:hypothetical protein MRB53_039534 [Persea americana]